MKFSSSEALTFSKLDTVKASRHLMALDPSHRLHVDAISTDCARKKMPINSHVQEYFNDICTTLGTIQMNGTIFFSFFWHFVK